MRRFVLVRDNDIHGISGEGLVVWGVCYPDGSCAYRWNSPHATSTVADDINKVRKIHVEGHDGGTKLVWIDPPEAMAIRTPRDIWVRTALREGGLDSPGRADPLEQHPNHTQPVGVAFDGLLHACKPGDGHLRIGDVPIEGAVEALKELAALHPVFVLTREEPMVPCDWLARHGAPTTTLLDLQLTHGVMYRIGPTWDRAGQILVTNHMMPAVAYLDPRALPFTEWDRVLDWARSLPRGDE